MYPGIPIDQSPTKLKPKQYPRRAKGSKRMDAGASPDDCSSTCAHGRAISTLHPLLSSRTDFNIKKSSSVGIRYAPTSNRRAPIEPWLDNDLNGAQEGKRMDAVGIEPTTFHRLRRCMRSDWRWMLGWCSRMVSNGVVLQIIPLRALLVLLL